MRHRRRSRLLVACGLSGLLLLAPPAGADADEEPIWPIERVSVSSEGAQPLLPSGGADMSADGRYVAFASGARLVAPSITNNAWDVFVHDGETGETERVSVASDGTESDNHSMGPAISGDGRYVVFHGRSRLLHPEKAHGGWDVFLRDRESGTTELLSRASDGTPSNSDALMPDISADGRWVVFHSPALVLDPTSTTGVFDLFLLDRETGELQRISRGNDGRSANWDSGWPRISADGSVVIYRSLATNLVPEVRHAGWNAWDIFAYDRHSGRTERLSVSSTGREPTQVVDGHVVGADGRYVAYHTRAALAPDVTNETSNVYVHDRVTGATERVARAWNGEEAGASAGAALSWDGRTVAFSGSGRDWVPDKTNLATEVYVHERGSALGVDRVRVDRVDDAVTVTGRVNFEGQVVAEAVADQDAQAVTRQAGGALRSARLIVRPQQGDLLARLVLEHLAGFRIDGLAGAAYCEFISCPNSMGGAPLMLYGFVFELDGVAYEARAQRPWTEGNPFATPPRFELYRCDGACELVSQLEGATGTTSDEVLLSLPLGQFGIEPGATLRDVRAYAATGHIEDGPAHMLSELALPAVTVPAPELRVTVGEQTVQASLLPLHRFTASVDTAASSPDETTVTLHACLGEVCAATTVTVAE